MSKHEEISISIDDFDRIFQLIASGKIRYIDNIQGHYYKVWAEELTKEEFELERKIEKRDDG